MRKFKYVGDAPADVPALDLVEVQPGQVVEVEDPDVSAGMDGSDSWEHIPDRRRQRAAKKAAAKRTKKKAEPSPAPPAETPVTEES